MNGHAKEMIQLNLTYSVVNICQHCMAKYDSYASAAREALAVKSKREGTPLRPEDYLGIRRGMTRMPPTVQCDMDTVPADPYRASDYAAGRYYWVCGPATPGAQPSVGHEHRLTMEAARDYAAERYGHRRDLARDSVRIERDGGALAEYAGPAR